MRTALLILLSVCAALAAVGGEAGLLSPGEAAAARKLYLNKCAKCHKMYEPAGYTDQQWESWVSKMGKKAKLKPKEQDALMKYVEQNLRQPREQGLSTNQIGSPVASGPAATVPRLWR